MKQFRIFIMFISLSVAFTLTACGRETETAVAPTNAPAVMEPEIVNQVNCTTKGETAEIAEARLYVEYNATDGDLGVHGGFDDHGWSEFCVYAPNGDQILGIMPQSQLGDLTLASIFFEGCEPELSEFSFDDLVTNFPEGQYEVRGLSFDGAILTGAATFSHNVPIEPVITAPALAEDEDTAVDSLVSVADLVVNWEDVTETVSGDTTVISGYEVIITKVDHDDPHGFSRPTFDVHLPPNQNSLSVPAEFLESNTVYELELLALEESGNQTISVGFFKTE